MIAVYGSPNYRFGAAFVHRMMGTPNRNDERRERALGARKEDLKAGRATDPHTIPGRSGNQDGANGFAAQAVAFGFASAADGV